MLSQKVENKKLIDALASALVTEYGVSDPCQLTTITLPHIGFWERVTFYNIHHCRPIAIVYAIFVPGSRVIAPIIQLFQSTYRPIDPKLEARPSVDQRQPLPAPRSKPLPPMDWLNLPNVNDAPKSQAEDAPHPSEGPAPRAPVSYLPKISPPAPAAPGAPDPAIGGPQPQNLDDPYEKALRGLDPTSAIATLTLQSGHPVFIPKPEETLTGAAIIGAATSAGGGIRAKFSQSDGVLSAKRLENLPLTVDGDQFSGAEYEIAYEIPDKINDAIQIIQADPAKEEKGLFARVVDWVAGDGTTAKASKAFTAFQSVMVGNRRPAFGFFPKSMPLDGDRTHWESDIRRQLRQVALDDGPLKTASKNSADGYVCTGELTDDVVQTLLCAAVIAKNPSLFDRMVLARSSTGKWRLLSYGKAGLTGDTAIDDGRGRASLRLLRARLRSMSGQ
jgi:hypothetical protein